MRQRTEVPSIYVVAIVVAFIVGFSMMTAVYIGGRANQSDNSEDIGRLSLEMEEVRRDLRDIKSEIDQHLGDVISERGSE